MILLQPWLKNLDDDLIEKPLPFYILAVTYEETGQFEKAKENYGHDIEVAGQKYSKITIQPLCSVLP